MRRFFNKFGKSFFTVMLAVSICLLALSGCSTYRGNARQIMEKLNVAAQLTENGDMNVRETWKVDLKNRSRAYRNLYRTFDLDPSKADGIADFSVYDEDEKTRYQFIGDIDPETDDSAPDNSSYMHQTGNLLEVGWFMPAVDEGVRTFTISYTVKNIVAVHQDTAVLYNFFNPKNFTMPITELDGSVRFPSGGSKSAVQAWLHSTANGNLTIDSADQISFAVKEIPANTSVEVRLCMPPQLFPASARKDTQAVLPQIQTEEQQWADEYAAEQQRQYLLGIWDAVGGGILLIAGIIVFVAVKRKNRRHLVDVPEYTRDIPPGNSPGGAANLFYFYSGGISKKVEGRVFSATLLSLARKGYVVFSDDGGVFSVSIAGNTKNLPLTESEQVFYNMISTVAGHYGGSFTMDQFKGFAELDCHYIENNMNAFLSSAKREISGRGYYETRPVFLTVVRVLGILGIMLSVILLPVTRSAQSTLVYIPLSLLISSILLIIAGSSKQKLTVKGEQDLGTWQGLKKYMLEFSRMTEYGVPQLALWEEYLVYATMMGISKRVCEQLKMVYPELNDETYVNTWYGGSYLYYMFGYRMGVPGFGTSGMDFGASLASAISDVSSAATRLANPPSSNGGGFGGFGGGGFGGGSFGGGGGGFGGGGGGGAR